MYGINTCSYQNQKKYLPKYPMDIRGIFRRIAEIIGSFLFFTVLIGGLNMFALFF